VEAHPEARESLGARVADSHPDPHRSKSLIQIRIEVKSRTCIRIKVILIQIRERPDPHQTDADPQH
jgi:hypothetical protein